MLATLNSPTVIIWAAVLIAAAWCIWRARFWWLEGRKLQMSGYLPPTPTWLSRVLSPLLKRAIFWLWLGKYRVKGRENVPAKGRLIVMGSHWYALDFAATIRSLPYMPGRVLRTCAASSELKGLQGFLGAWDGSWGVNKDDPKELRLRAIDAGAECLIGKSSDPAGGRNNMLFWWPQGTLLEHKWDANGKLSLTNWKGENVGLVESFRGNYAQVLARVLDALPEDEPLYILPLGFYYKKNPDEAGGLFWLLDRLGFVRSLRGAFGKRNHGVNVVIGQAIRVTKDNLPATADKASQFAHDIIMPLVEEARRMG